MTARGDHRGGSVPIARRDRAELADEFVLGLLDPDEAAWVAERMESDPMLQEAVARSRDRFLELDASLAGPPPSATLWGRVLAALEAQQSFAPSPIEDLALARARRAQARWRFSALASLAAALAMAVGLTLLALRPSSEPIVIAVLLDPAGEPVAMVEGFGGSAARLVPLVDFRVPDNRVMQVWTKYSEEVGPVSLGVLPASRAQRLAGEGLPFPVERQLFEITLEQPGGSPTGRPTGPILAKGFAKAPRLARP